MLLQAYGKFVNVHTKIYVKNMDGYVFLGERERERKKKEKQTTTKKEAGRHFFACNEHMPSVM